MEKYTTTALTEADKTGVETKKTIISDDAFAVVDLLEVLSKKIERLIK